MQMEHLRRLPKFRRHLTMHECIRSTAFQNVPKTPAAIKSNPARSRLKAHESRSPFHYALLFQEGFTLGFVTEDEEGSSAFALRRDHGKGAGLVGLSCWFAFVLGKRGRAPLMAAMVFFELLP